MPRRTDDQRRNENRGRKDSRRGPAVAGYIDPGGRPLAQAGDEQAPYIHVPPFPTELERLVDISHPPLLGQNQSYVFSDEVDVEWARQVTLFVRFASENGGTSLALVAEAFDERAQEWFPLPHIGTFITPIADPVGGVSLGLFARQLLSAAIGSGKIFRVTVSFDVAPYRKVRVGYAESGPMSSGNSTTLVIDVSTSQ